MSTSIEPNPRISDMHIRSLKQLSPQIQEHIERLDISLRGEIEELEDTTWGK